MNTSDFNGITEFSELTEFFVKEMNTMKLGNERLVEREVFPPLVPSPISLIPRIP